MTASEVLVSLWTVETATAPVGSRQRGTLLNGVLVLGEVENGESFARKVLDERLKAMGAFLNPTEYDDALSYLVAELWMLHGRFDPSKGVRFSTYAYRILWRRVASWYRQRFIDTRYRSKPVMVSLEDTDTLASPGDELPLGRINVAALTPEGRMILSRLARPMVEEDLSLQQAAEQFGYGRRWCREALDRLRDEIRPMLEQRQ